MYVWFLLAYLPYLFNPTLNIKMVFGEKIPKMGTFSEFVTIFFVKCYNNSHLSCKHIHSPLKEYAIFFFFKKKT